MGRATRLGRGVAAATAATFVALLSHVAAGGAMPGWLGIALPWVFAVLVSLPLTGRRPSWWRLGLLVVLSQALFHALFVLGAGTGGGTALVGVGHHGEQMVLPGGSSGASAHAGHLILTADPLMWAAHAFAALATIAVLHRGESAARRLLALAAELGVWLRRAVVLVFALPRIAAPRPVSPFAESSPRLPRPPHLSSVVRRGPPALI